MPPLPVPHLYEDRQGNLYETEGEQVRPEQG
jgi:hypothetical protein